VKRRDAIRDLYSATSAPEKLAVANPQPDRGTDQVSTDSADRVPSQERLAMANSRPEDMVDRTDQSRALTTERASSPEKLAMANSRPGAMSQDGRVLAGPVRAMSLSLNRLDEDRRVLQEALARGETIVDIDPTLIDPSFVKDRLDYHGDSFADFKRVIEERGQEVPILVRPHPDHPGRYQVAYGHRRLRALRELGRQVRAVVRALDDAQLVVAQGLENSARQDLTYIEKALFARRLEDRGFERSVIIDALSTDKGELSKLIAVARAVPESIVSRIGPAPKAGRRRWLALAEQMKRPLVAKEVEEAVMEEAFASLDSDARFVRVAALAAPQNRHASVSTSWAGQGGRATAQISRKGTGVTLAIERDPSFGDYVASRLDELYAAFLAEDRSRTPRESERGNAANGKD
jgi:ParB family transcriptional regulator, chromosome partitioning protein